MKDDRGWVIQTREKRFHDWDTWWRTAAQTKQEAIFWHDQCREPKFTFRYMSKRRLARAVHCESEP